MGWSTRALIIVALSASSSCGLFENLACDDPCQGSTEPSRGEPADFTHAGRDDETATITTPVACDDYGDLRSHVAMVTTHGSDTEVDFGDWVLERLVPELQARELHVGRGIVQCPLIGETIDYGLITDDWQKLDAVAQTVLDVAAEDDVAIEISLEVEPVMILCPADDCGA